MRRPLALVLLLAPLAPAQKPTADEQAAAAAAAALDDFDAWFAGYREGTFRLVRHDAEDPAAIAEVERRLAELAAVGTLEAAQRLLEAAAVEPDLPGAKSSTDRVTFVHELEPWVVRERARKQLAAMTAPGLDAWLIAELTKSFDDPNAQRDPRRGAVIQVLAARGSATGLDVVLQSTRRLQPEDRAKAIDALGALATLEMVPEFVGLLRDVDPGVRIAAVNALGRTLAPHVDERRADPIDAEAAKMRDVALPRMGDLLERDKVWQVRAAAADNLARLGTKLAVPLLIDGLEAEARRKKDPWAMDVRLTRLLGGMTGQQIMQGDVQSWRQWWRQHGDAFRFTDSADKAAASQAAASKGGRTYQEFFTLQVQSDRVLFIVDFSGSMAEPVKLQTQTTAAAAGRTTTKAQLVVDELKRVVMSLPDHTRFNLIVFSDDVRIWRRHPNGGAMLVELDDAARDDLLGSFLDSLHPAGATNLYGALSAALDLGGRGLHDKYYDVGFDTLYVMSDGSPSYGEIIDTDEILRRVREANALQRVVINAVTFGDKNEMRFLKRLAEENGGRHVHVD